jgi:hypothetical protein
VSADQLRTAIEILIQHLRKFAVVPISESRQHLREKLFYLIIGQPLDALEDAPHTCFAAVEEGKRDHPLVVGFNPDR